MKEDYDGAEPAASSVALANRLRLVGYSGTEASGAGGQRADAVVWRRVVAAL